MPTRAEQKQQSLKKILDVTSRRMREQGIEGASIANVMKEAGLTHGAFYSHFENKEELACAAFRHAIDSTQKPWFGRQRQESFAERLRRMARSYLSRRHRDEVGEGCAISALATTAPRAGESFRETFESAIEETLATIADGDEDRDYQQGEEAKRKTLGHQCS